MGEHRGDIESEEQAPKSGHPIFIWVVIVLVVYVLSVGPAARICSVHFRRNGWREDKLTRAAEVFYAPLVPWLDSPVGGPLGSWIQWCMRTDQTTNSKGR